MVIFLLLLPGYNARMHAYLFVYQKMQEQYSELFKKKEKNMSKTVRSAFDR